MKQSIKKGLSFGLTSGVITTLGLIVGLNASTHSALVIISGILVIAIADALSDSMGMYMSEESTFNRSLRQIWEAAIATFLGKFIFALSFVLPFLIFSVYWATIINVIWAIFLIGTLSYFIAKSEKINPTKSIIWHLTVTGVVIISTYYVGHLASLLK